jgi:hypothetical protein
MFLWEKEMNYQKIYNSLIAKAQARATVDGYKERHHIVPRSLGGSDDKSNLVELTAREHFIAHMCLSLIHGGTQWYAICMMKSRYNNSRLYAIAREQFSATRKGIPLSEEHARKVTEALNITMTPEKIIKRGVSINLSKKGKPLSEKNRLALRGKRAPWSDARRQAQQFANMPASQGIKISQALKGRKKTPEHIAAAAEGRKRANFNRKCIALNALIDSVFSTDAALASA